MFFTRLMKNVFSIFGFEMQRTTNIHNSFEDHLVNVIRKNNIDCILDVGANVGQYGESLRTLGYEGWIVSFEPVKAVFDKLEGRTKNDKKWLCYHFALGEKVEDKIINVNNSTVFSSFLQATNYAKGIWGSLDEVDCENVSVVTLDCVFSEIQKRTGAKKYYLKLDTQGYDLNVFRGSKKSLSHVLAMQSEISLIHIYEKMQNPYKTLEEFNSNGFFISGMYPINRDVNLAVIEFDAVLVRVDIADS
jgi:FkbM family methyltransferase